MEDTLVVTRKTEPLLCPVAPSSRAGTWVLDLMHVASQAACNFAFLCSGLDFSECMNRCHLNASVWGQCEGELVCTFDGSLGFF